MLHRYFTWLLTHRRAGAALALALTGLLGVFALRVRPDHSIESLFPVWSPTRNLYNAFKARYPYEDMRAIVVAHAGDLWTPAGLRRMQKLEEELAKVSAVVSVQGPMSVKDMVGVEGGIQNEPLLPTPDLSAEELARKKAIATTDPLFAWSLAKPDGLTLSIQVTLDPRVASHDDGRQQFLRDAREVLSRNAHPGQRLVLTGVPSLRAIFAEMIGEDIAVLLPAALLAVLVLMFFSFRNVGAVLAGLGTIVAALIWAYGTLGMMGFPLSILASLLPIFIIVISISDTVHIVNEFTGLVRAGKDRREALLEAMTRTALPCLATEVVLAIGFLTLGLVNIVAITQLGVATAAGMLLTWLANMVVLPLLLSVTRPSTAAERGESGLLKAFTRFIDWIARQVTERPRRVVVVFCVILLIAGSALPTLKKLAYVFDDLRPESPLAEEIRFAEAQFGGLFPVVMYIEAAGKQDAPALSPTAVALADRAAKFLRTQPEIGHAASAADFLRKAHRQLLGADWEQGMPELPPSRSLIMQELTMIDDGTNLRDYVSFDRKTLAAVGWVKDVGSIEVSKLFGRIDDWLARERAALGELPEGDQLTIRPTAQLAIFKDVNETLLDGLFLSFGGSVLTSFLVMCVILRSWRLGVIGLIPNLAPLILIIGFMAALGVNLKPLTVVLFSITLVIAEDDTIQYLARFRGNYLTALGAGSKDAHRDAALACLREVGLPMVITTTSVTGGFLLLTLSRFLGLAHLGILIGATLFAAVFADLFITPILLIKLRPLRHLTPAPREGESLAPSA